ncbi:MAG TPA: efflux RND transporter periplasmic adaptor subunit [Opitutaceae bacterium]|nr:efflux RND transporter periplasmic adaptor subunit [Opitutaceae bacterium]
MATLFARRYRVCGCLVGACLAYASAPAATPFVTVHAQAFSDELKSYAQVQPIALLPVRSPVPGVVQNLDVVRGAAVTRGQVLAQLTGPEIDAASARARAAASSAAARLTAARHALGILRTQLATHLSTRQQVAQAESDVADATGAVAVANADLAAAKHLAAITAPVAGTIVSTDATNGQRLAGGDALLTIRPADNLWLAAEFYGRRAAEIRPGMSGTFVPDDNGAPISVQVVSALAGASTGGGASVGLRATGDSPAWRDGEFGRVVLRGRERSLVAVPSEALVLDQGRWWVLVHSGEQDKPVEVVPGPSRGWFTYLERGLAPGAQVVVENAYLEFHRDISRRYQPPD